MLQVVLLCSLSETIAQLPLTYVMGNLPPDPRNITISDVLQDGMIGAFEPANGSAAYVVSLIARRPLRSVLRQLLRRGGHATLTFFLF